MRRGTFIDADGVAHVEDVHGWPVTIPARRLPGLLADAKQADNELAPFALQWFHRDALQGVTNLAVDRGLLAVCTYVDAYAACETPTVFDPADTRPKCDAHKDVTR
jgi:hypothetical protein